MIILSNKKYKNLKENIKNRDDVIKSLMKEVENYKNNVEFLQNNLTPAKKKLLGIEQQKKNAN